MTAAPTPRTPVDLPDDMPTAIGPILHLRDPQPGRPGLHLHALVLRPEGQAPGVLSVEGAPIVPERLADLCGLTAWRYDFTLPEGADGYVFEGRRHPVVTRHHEDLRLGFVSCNGEEHGDLTRDQGERNAMWDRLLDEHAARPLAVLIQGGDQIYADEATDGHPISDGWPDTYAEAPSPADLASLEAHLTARFVERYMRVLAAPGPARLMAEVPTLAVWDDHDICDGWGSLKREDTASAVGQCLFRVARRCCLLFQHGATDADAAALFHDPQGRALGWTRRLPGLVLVGPDLRSERGRRQVLGTAGWAALDALDPEPGAHVVMVSSVPLLGPRLSLVEGLMMMFPGMQKYEDDLRDQWQSRAHRSEWQRMLTRVLDWRKAGPVTVISGEIHLATRAVMAAEPGPVHQLVASGIAHRAPPMAYARGLGALAGLGEAPLPGHPIKIRPLPGQPNRYTAERNFLILERRGGTWTAAWHLEESGRTPDLGLG